MDKEIGIDRQSHPHEEGAQHNITTQQEGTGQRVSKNNSMGLSNMMNESESQQAGRAHEPQDKDNLQQKEKNVQQDERQP